MAIVNMEKIALTALESEKNNVLAALQAIGALHVVPINADVETTISVNPFNTERLEMLESEKHMVMQALQILQKSFDPTQTMKGKKREVIHKQVLTEEALEALYADKGTMLSFVQECLLKEKNLVMLDVKLSKLAQTSESLFPWKALSEPLALYKDTKNTLVKLGTVNKELSDGFEQQLKAQLTYLSLSRIYEADQQIYYLLICHNTEEQSLRDIISQTGFIIADFEAYALTVAEEIQKIDRERAMIKIEMDNIQLQLLEMREKAHSLETFLDILNILIDRENAKHHALSTKKTFMIQAWVPIGLLEHLHKSLLKITPYHAIKVIPPEPNEVMPTLLKNHRFVEPLEFITEQYSVPSSQGVDPNAMMMPFFVIFFGIMVSDAVYGALIVLIAGFILKKLRPEGNFKKMIGVMILGGISTSLWGVMFGGWLGGMIHVSPILFNPLEEPFKMIGMCLAFGVLHLFIGFGMQAHLNIKRGYWMEAFLDQGLWVLFIISIMSLALTGLAPYNRYVAMGFALSLILTQGRRKKNPVLKLLTGILSLYNITGFLGDVLSYLRLFALGLATGVIGTVINSMALMLGGSLLGTFFMVVILIVGHTFNIAINVLGAYVHSSRLQYVEFFSKFYEGDGIKYNPFRIKARYVDLIEHEEANR